MLAAQQVCHQSWTRRLAVSIGDGQRQPVLSLGTTLRRETALHRVRMEARRPASIPRDERGRVSELWISTCRTHPEATETSDMHPHSIAGRPVMMAGIGARAGWARVRGREGVSLGLLDGN